MKLSDMITYGKETIGMMNFMNKKRKLHYYVGMIASGAVNTLFILSFSLVVQSLVNYAESKDISLMYQGLYILGGSILLLNLISPPFTYLFHRSVELTLANIREQLYRKLCKLRVSLLERTHNGELLSRMNNDVSTLEVTYCGILFAMLLEIMISLGSIIMMFVVHWQFACVSLLVLLLSFYISSRFVNTVRNLYDRHLSITAKLTEKFSDFLGGIQQVKLFRIRPIYEQYEGLNEEVTDLSTRIAHKKGMLAAINHFVSYITFCGIIVIGSLLYSYGYITMGAVAALAVLQIHLTHSFMNVGSTMSLIQNSLAGAKRVQELLKEEEEPERINCAAETGIGKTDLAEAHNSTTDGAATAERGLTSITDMNEKIGEIGITEPVVDLRDVEFSYASGEPAICKVSLQVYPGQAAAIVGASGSGKSTLIKLLLGFYPIDSGEVRIQGKSFGQYTLEEVRRLIAYVPQEAFLFSGTIEDNIRYGNPQASHEEVVAAAQAAYAHHFIQELPDQYQTTVGERGASLSGGQRQRIAIARALLKNAPILLLDEATSALDTESEHWVQKALQQLMQGRTTIMVAHRLSTVENADIIFVMKEGVVAERGTHRSLLQHGAYYASLQGQA
ncbi:ABC transporter ATP-binding protein [Paenibacillus alvei]|uniref:ABC transporter ATP-binding protein n=2 Tax=Paenibacillus TaxID=44249 RepID=UPI000289DDB8|nr:ABC transporter, ATP-binding protein [Paenibacillus alvei DSM 29]